MFYLLCVFIVSLHYCSSRKGKIWNSDDVSIGRFPSLVILRQHNVTADLYGCTGALIGPRHVVTVGVCVARRSNHSIFFDGYVVAGTIKTHACESPCEKRRVEEVYLHPGFKKDKEDFDDIAVLRLLFEFPSNDFIRPVEFATDPPPTGSRVIIVGIGATTKEKHPENVKYAATKVQKMSFCGSSRQLDDPRVLCIGSYRDKVVRTASGDGGAPAYYVDQVVAIDSQHELQKPGSYAVSLAHYRPYIELIMAKSSKFRKLPRKKISSNSSKKNLKLCVAMFILASAVSVSDKTIYVE